MSVLFKKITIGTAVAVFCAVIILVLISTLSAEDITPVSETSSGVPVKTIHAEKGTLTKTLRLNGYIQSDNIVTVIPFVSGTLEEISVEVGDIVEKNQTIARIDSRAYELQLKQAEAAYFGAKSSFERVEQLYKSNAATQQNYDQSRSQYEAYQSQYELAKLQVSYTNISSPIDGTVLVIHANKGSIAAPELPIMTIGDLNNLIVKLNVPDKYYETFRSTEHMKISIIRPKLESEPFSAKLINISPIIDAETRNFEVSCSIEGELSKLRPGMFVYCIFETDILEDSFYLPQSVMGAGRTVWYVEKKNSTAHKLKLEDPFMNSDYFAIPEDKADLDFIIEGQSFLQEGRLVNIR